MPLGRFLSRSPQSASANAAPLAATAIHRNLLLAGSEVWAWFRLESEPWAFRTTRDRAAIMDAATIRWADLAGHRVHLRRTAHPYPYTVWARKLDRATPNPLAVPEGAPTWGDYLAGAQDRLAGLRMETPASYVGVRVCVGKYAPADLPRIFQHSDVADAKVVRARGDLTRVTSTIAKAGFRGAPVNSRTLGWLIHASVGIGAPVSAAAVAGPAATWGPEDMDTFTHPVHVSAGPLDKTLTMRGLRDGAEHVRHVAVLSVGRMNDQLDTESPTFEPWLAAADRLPFPVEWSATFDVLGPTVMGRKASFIRQRAESMEEHYAEHGETQPPSVARGIRDAVRIEDEIVEGDREVAVRCVGPIRCAVTAPTEDEALERVATLADEYAMRHRIALNHTYGQYPMYREFIPGEPASDSGFQRVLPGYYAATAVPNASTALGDGEGLYLGRSGHRPVMMDPTWGPRHNQSGLGLIGGTLGSGKSTLAGVIGEGSARRGHQTVILDPAGSLARLCHMPALANQARHVELSGAEPGTLNPYWLIPEPKRTAYDREKDYTAAVREANAERRDLMVDAATMLLAERTPGALRAIEHAVNEVGGEYATNPWRVVRALEGGDQHARGLAAQLRDAAQMKGARLIFPEDESARTDTAASFGDAVLTVITMRGITVPDAAAPRDHWTRSERMAAPVLHLAARYAMRAMYANTHPKTILVDEAGIVTAGSSSMRAFTTRGARDSRKSNTFLGILSQNPADLLELAPQIANLIGAAFCGKISGGETAAAALPLLGVPAGHGYEKVLAHLEPGQFLMRDWLGRVGQVDVDLGWRPDLADTLDTTPPQSDATDPEASWTDELVLS